MTKQTAAALRAEADRIEAEELKAERMKTADTIPTCPECGGRSFEVSTYTIVSMSISYEDDEDDGNWDEDYQSGDHTDVNSGATCNGCGANVQEMLERHRWTFYDDPKPLKPSATPTREDVAAAFAVLDRYDGFGDASSQLLHELEQIFDPDTYNN